MVTRLEVVAALLAAGAGSRFEGPTHKLLAPFRGKPLYRWAYDAVVDSRLPFVVVTGGIDLDVPEAIGNRRWAEGIATSLQVAVRAASAVGADALVVGLADQPLVPAEAWQLVATAHPDAPIVAATYDGRRRNPVRLARALWSSLPTEGDQGASALFGDHTVVEVACPGDPADVDRLEDLEQWS